MTGGLELGPRRNCKGDEELTGSVPLRKRRGKNMGSSWEKRGFQGAGNEKKEGRRGPRTGVTGSQRNKGRGKSVHKGNSGKGDR